MIDVKDNTLLREIPDNLLKDEKVVNMAKALQSSLDKMLCWADKINYTKDLHQVDDAVLDHLLWENGITWFKGLALINDREKKIKFIENAVEIHRLKGTAAAIEFVCGLLNINTEISEWFEYEGDAYHFRVEMMEVIDRGVNAETMELLERLVKEYKNVRSEVDVINIYLTSKHEPRYAGTCQASETITVYPMRPKDIATSDVFGVVAATTMLEIITVYPREVTN